MNKCQYYKGTETVSSTSTKLKCACMEAGGIVLENKDPKANELISRCWKDGEGCPYKTAHETGSVEEINAVSEGMDQEQYTFADTASEAVPNAHAVVETSSAQLELQDRAATLHRRILVNSQIAVECIVAIAKDLRTIHDEKLYTYLGCENFDSYCVQQLGFRQRQGYNYLRALNVLGEKQLAENSHLGITKLADLAMLNAEDRQQLIESGEAEEMSTRELKEEIARLNSRCEQLTLDLGEADNKSKTELELLTEQLEGMKARLKTAEKSVEVERSQREDADSTAKALEEKVIELSEKLKDAENRPIDVAVQKPSDEELEKIREEARAEEKKLQEKITAEKDKLHKDEIKKIKEKADNARLTAVEAARKQEAEKFAAEMEKLRAENATLQSNAQKPAPTENKALLKYRVSNIQNEFNAAVALLGSFEPEEKEKYKTALKTTAEKILEVLNDV